MKNLKIILEHNIQNTEETWDKFTTGLMQEINKFFNIKHVKLTHNNKNNTMNYKNNIQLCS